jgi:hypothetical protein
MGHWQRRGCDSDAEKHVVVSCVYQGLSFISLLSFITPLLCHRIGSCSSRIQTCRRGPSRCVAFTSPTYLFLQLAIFNKYFQRNRSYQLVVIKNYIQYILPMARGILVHEQHLAVIQKVTNLSPLGLKWVRMATLRPRVSSGY